MCIDQRLSAAGDLFIRNCGLGLPFGEGFTMGKLAALGRKLSIGLLGLFVSIF